MATADDVALWMADQLVAYYDLDQQQAAYEIQDKFGEEFLYQNENGNLAISKDVLKKFRALTKDTVVWDRGHRAWRRREPYDPKGKRQAE